MFAIEVVCHVIAPSLTPDSYTCPLETRSRLGLERVFVLENGLSEQRNLGCIDLFFLKQR